MMIKMLKLAANIFLMIINVFLASKYIELTIGFYEPFFLEHLLNLFWSQFGAGVIFAISEDFQVGMLAVPVFAVVGLFIAWVIGMEIKKVRKPAYWSISLVVLIIFNMLFFPLIVSAPLL